MRKKILMSDNQAITLFNSLRRKCVYNFKTPLEFKDNEISNNDKEYFFNIIGNPKLIIKYRINFEYILNDRQIVFIASNGIKINEIKLGYLSVEFNCPLYQLNLLNKELNILFLRKLNKEALKKGNILHRYLEILDNPPPKCINYYFTLPEDISPNIIRYLQKKYRHNLKIICTTDKTNRYNINNFDIIKNPYSTKESFNFIKTNKPKFNIIIRKTKFKRLFLEIYNGELNEDKNTIKIKMRIRITDLLFIYKQYPESIIQEVLEELNYKTLKDYFIQFNQNFYYFKRMVINKIINFIK